MGPERSIVYNASCIARQLKDRCRADRYCLSYFSDMYVNPACKFIK